MPEFTNNLIDVQANQGKLIERVQRILAEADSQGATDAEVAVSERVGLEVTVRKAEIETVEFNQDRGFGITVYVGQRKGSANTSDSTDQAIVDTVRAALNIAKYTEEDDCSGLAEANLMATAFPDLDLYHPWDLDVGLAESLAKTCEAETLATDKRIIQTEGATVSTTQSCSVYGNSHGFTGSSCGTRHSLSCVAIARDDKGMQTDHWYTLSRQAQQLEDAAQVGRETAVRTVAHLEARDIKTGSMPVLFSPQMSSGLISHLISAISGGALYTKASFLLDALGESVTSGHLSVIEDPFVLGGMGSGSFDGDGIATSKKTFIDKGILQSYVLGTYSARRLGLASTGNAGGVHNLSLTGETRSFDELLKEMSNGILVTSLMGQGVNIVDGNYSRGATGFRVENGEIIHPVEEITIASNLKDMFCNIVAIGDDVDRRGNIQTPSILIGEMTVAAS